MLLVVDVGNTQTHFGVFEGEELVHSWRFATVRSSTADELGAQLRNLMSLREMTVDAVTASIVSSTVPQLAEEWRVMSLRYLAEEMLVVRPGVKTGMALRYDNPREIGADRLVNAVAAYDKVKGACVVVDFGTAITFDPVSADYEYLGGVIMPGIEISLEALTNRAAALPRIDLTTAPTRVIGKSTVEAIRIGMLYGYAGAIDGICDRLLEEMGPDTVLLATGGLARQVVPYCNSIETVDDMLTLTGLRLIHGLNS